MLSRVAADLFWMSRYVERAESIARLVDVNLQLLLDLPSRQAERFRKDWLPIVASLGTEATFRKLSRRADAAGVTEFLVFSRDHLTSVVGCLSAARENARIAREQISESMWEQLNRAYLWCISKGAHQSFERNAYEFFDRVIKSFQLFHGITDTIMLHGEGWEFIQLGKYLERADGTTRVLDEEFHLLRRDGESPNDRLLQWLAVLRSCNARQTYRRTYASVVDPVRAAALLLLRQDFPRSVAFCIAKVDQALRRISGVNPAQPFSNQAEKLSGRLVGELRFSSVEDLLERGLHVLVDDLQVKFNAIGDAIYQTYLDPPTHAPLPSPPTTEQPPQQ